MNYLIGSEWKDYFEYICVNSKKPKFYESKAEFREVDPITGNMLRKPISILEKKKVYANGSLKCFKEQSHIDKSEVLQLGDSIYADLYAAKREHNWKTGAIVSELKYESQVMNSKE